MTQVTTTDELLPSHPLVRDTTMRALGQRIEPSEIKAFLDKASSAAVPAPIGATASVNVAVWGKAHCEPDGQPWVFDTTIWGGPAYFGSAVGFMYTAYESWDAFFQNVTGVHVQGIISGGGILQINWLAGQTPVGQFNGAAGGIGVLEAGGDGRWSHK